MLYTSFGALVVPSNTFRSGVPPKGLIRCLHGTCAHAPVRDPSRTVPFYCCRSKPRPAPLYDGLQCPCAMCCPQKPAAGDPWLCCWQSIYIGMYLAHSSDRRYRLKDLNTVDPEAKRLSACTTLGPDVDALREIGRAHV